MNTITLDIPLKGGRDYIQGPDLFNAAFETLKEKVGGTLGALYDRLMAPSGPR